MSSTEIFVFDKEGDAIGYEDIKNSWRGAMAIWNELDFRYLPKYIPDWALVLNQDRSKHYHRSSDEKEIKKIWDLQNDNRLLECEKIVLLSTFDNVIVKIENVDRLIKAFNDFKFKWYDDTKIIPSLKEQAIVFEKIKKEYDYIATAWNQTSVNGNTWGNYNYDKEQEETSPYNFLKQKDHWFLFDEI